MEEGTLLAFGMNGGLLKPDHGFPMRAVVSGWAAVASVKWLGRIHVSDTPLSSPWNTDKYVLTGAKFGARREPVEERGVKSALELPWPARLPAGRHVLYGRSWSGSGAISFIEFSVDGGPWLGARLFGENIPGAWARWSLGGTQRRAGTRSGSGHSEAGNAQPDEVGWNDLGYLYDASSGTPSRCSRG